jgi:hypothetical protein
VAPPKDEIIVGSHPPKFDTSVMKRLGPVHTTSSNAWGATSLGAQTANYYSASMLVGGGAKQ